MAYFLSCRLWKILVYTSIWLNMVPYQSSVTLGCKMTYKSQFDTGVKTGHTSSHKVLNLMQA